MKNRSNKPLKLRKLRRLITAFEQAAKDYSWRGSLSPLLQIDAEKTYRRVKRDLYKELRSVEKDMDDLITTLRTLVD